MHRFDVTRRARGIAQGLAQVADAARQGGVAHDRVPPHRGEHLVLRDQALRMPDQVPQDGKHPRHQLQAPLTAPR